MNIKSAYLILERHNLWRRDNQGLIPMENPTRLGIAIDTILEHIRKDLEARNVI